MQNAFFFGYGSLVNANTHKHGPCVPVKLDGWKRAWRFTEARNLSFLTVVQDTSASVQGVIAPVPNSDWDALDAREHAYDRIDATDNIPNTPPMAEQIAVYAIAPEKLNEPDDHHPVLLSYIDVVIQGFLQVYGQDGVTQFMETTTGWNAPILNDRPKPVYPRAQTLSKQETHLVDLSLSSVGARVLCP